MVEDRFFFDTNVLWHGLLPSEDPVSDICRRLMRAVDDGEIRGYASALTLVELPKVITPGLPVEKLVALTETLRGSQITWVPLDTTIAMRARALSLVGSVAPAYDAAVLASAIEVRAHVLYTHDRDDFPVGEIVEGVAVLAPALPSSLAQISLLDGHEEE